jgi:hypothetical protein
MEDRMSKAKIIAKLVEAGHEDLAEQLLSSPEHVQAKAVGETFPDALVFPTVDYISFTTMVAIGGALQPLGTEVRKLEAAGKAAKKASEKMLNAAKKMKDNPTAAHVIRERSPAGPFINYSQTKPHLMTVMYIWYYSNPFSPQQLSDLDSIVKAAGLKGGMGIS